MAVKYSNNAFSTLSGAITNSATSISVASATTFPTLSGSDHMYLSIIGAAYTEIVKVTGVSGTTLTVVRGQDGTTGTAAASADRVELRITTAMLQDAFAESNNDVFKTIAVSGQSDIVADASTDTLTIVGSGGTSVTTNAGTDTLTISSTTVPDNIFKTIAVSGQSDIVADATTDTLTLVASGGTTITTNAGTDTLTIDTPTAGVSAGFAIAMSIAL
jgi:hypothetical protein